MIKKLRFKLIAVAMLAMFLVLGVIMATVNVLNYRSIVEEADAILAVLELNEGKFPTKDKNRDNKENDQGEKRNGHNNHSEDERDMSVEVPYESRFFSALVDPAGQVVAAETSHIAAVDDAAVVEIAQTVLKKGDRQGFYDCYRYIVCDRTEGKQVIFLDCTRNLNTFYRFLWASLSISGVGLVAVFILILAMSSRIVRPVSESYEKQKRFITDAGHEIKTPITIIDADAEVLEMEGGTNEWLQDIRAQSQRMRDLTDKLIYLSRMEEEKMQLQAIDFPLSDMVAETAQSFKAVAIKENKQLEPEVEPMLSLKGDQKAIRQLIGILLDNAIKYSPAEGVIRLSLKKQGKTIVLTVTNPTQELRREDLPHLFDRFYRADKSRNSQTGGYGIGLSIAQAVTQAHKGKITAASADGKSLTVTVVLPAQ